MPGASPLKNPLDWKVNPLMLYVSGAVPPEPLAVIVPVLVLQAAEVVVAVTVGALLALTVTLTVLVHPFASFIVI